MQAHDLAGVDVGGDRHLAGLRVGADEPAHEEVALQVVGLVGVDDDPDQQPALHEPQVLGRELLDRLAQLLQRGLAGQLADHVALAGGDRQLGPDRRRALRDHRQHLDAVQPHADRAVADDLVADEQHRSRRRASGPEASPPSSGSIGEDSVRKRSTASVGKVTGSASRIAPSAPARSGHAGQRAGALLELLDRRVERRGACRRRGSPPTPTPRTRPRSRARGRSRRPRRSRSGSSGASTSWIASSTASGAARIAPETNTTASSQGAPSSSDGRRRRRLERRRARGPGRSRGRFRCGRAWSADDTAHAPRADCEAGVARQRGRILARRVSSRHRRVRAHRRGQDRGRDRARRAPARARRGPGRRLGRRDAGLRGPADPHRRREPREQRQLEHRLLGFVPITRDLLRRRLRRTRARRRSTRCSRNGRRPIVVGGTGLYLRAALAELDLRPPVDPAIRAALRQRPAAARTSSTPRCPKPCEPGIEPTDRQRILRAHELLAAGHEPPPPAHAPSAAVDHATPATRRCWPRW